jgi:hypothetical protein
LPKPRPASNSHVSFGKVSNGLQRGVLFYRLHRQSTFSEKDARNLALWLETSDPALGYMQDPEDARHPVLSSPPEEVF